MSRVYIHILALRVRYVRYTLACNARSFSWFEFARHFESHLARPPPFLYANANTTTSDEHSTVTMLHSTRITQYGSTVYIGIAMVYYH